MKEIVKIISTEHLTHDVIKLVVEKPETLNYKPGQAIDISINNPAWEEELRPFTFTSLPEDEYLEFTIKTYPDHHGVTEKLLSLKQGDALIIHEVFGDILYKGEGVFIAGGAGVTPFISILRQLEKENNIANNKLILANKTRKDIIYEAYFKNLLGTNSVNVLSEETIEGYIHGRITSEIIKKHILNDHQYYYICGPEPMMEAIENQLSSLGVPNQFIVKESF